MHFRLVLIYDLPEDRRRDDINNIFLFYHIKQIDSMLPLVCTVINHR